MTKVIVIPFILLIIVLISGCVQEKQPRTEQKLVLKTDNIQVTNVSFENPKSGFSGIIFTH
jgi:PBP1b-binding outer membrane lipoprotein LpoB